MELHSVKVSLTMDLAVSAARVWADPRKLYFASL